MKCLRWPCYLSRLWVFKLAKKLLKFWSIWNNYYHTVKVTKTWLGWGGWGWLKIMEIIDKLHWVDADYAVYTVYNLEHEPPINPAETVFTPGSRCSNHTKFVCVCVCVRGCGGGGGCVCVCVCILMDTVTQLSKDTKNKDHGGFFNTCELLPLSMLIIKGKVIKMMKSKLTVYLFG